MNIEDMAPLGVAEQERSNAVRYIRYMMANMPPEFEAKLDKTKGSHVAIKVLATTADHLERGVHNDPTVLEELDNNGF